ncbi:hypothetical protein ACFWUU_09995 [Kribbella sp. NPDC058693]|uniref:hypothetical protein n=1 Tax=Kribbella sp. NPDC058693 TaxID=3346602 RepID=UPI0036556626
MTTGEVKAALTHARLPRARSMNVAQVFASAGALVDSADINEKGHKLWHLTETGSKEIRSALGLPDGQPEIAVDVATLEKAAKNISDSLAREFVEEAITCLQVGAMKAAVVFAWTGAIRTLHDSASILGWPAVTSAIQKHDARVKAVGKIEDFAQVKDKTFLLAARDLAILDKGEWTVMQQALDLRNQCGHPSNYRPGHKRVSAFIEDLISIAFKRRHQLDR